MRVHKRSVEIGSDAVNTSQFSSHIHKQAEKHNFEQRPTFNNELNKFWLSAPTKTRESPSKIQMRASRSNHESFSKVSDGLSGPKENQHPNSPAFAAQGEKRG